MVFVDNADHARSLAYHDLTSDGLPMARVFVKTALAGKTPVSVAATHELVEMLVDPSLTLIAMRPHSRYIYHYEAADPVEDLHFPVNGLPMTNFIYPAWFEHFHKKGSVRFDHMKALNEPFQIHAGGYQNVHKDGQWTALYGSIGKQRQHARQDRRGRRATQRNAKKLVRSG
jgi:hypothetical protein